MYRCDGIYQFGSLGYLVKSQAEKYRNENNHNYVTAVYLETEIEVEE